MKQIENRKSPSQSKRKIVNMIKLYEKYVDEPIKTISIIAPNIYLINGEWGVDIETNKVNRVYPDPE